MNNTNKNQTFSIYRVTSKKNYRRIILEIKKIEEIINFNINYETSIIYVEFCGDLDNITLKLKKAFTKYEKSADILPIAYQERYRKVLKLKGLDCGHCATRIENLAKKTFSYDKLVVDFATERFIIETTDSNLAQNIVARVSEVAHKIDNNIIVMDVATRQRVANEEDYKINRKKFVVFLIGVAFLLIYAIHTIVKYKGFIWTNHDYHTYQDIPGIILLGLSFILISYRVIWKFIRSILGGRILDENCLMTIACIGSIVSGHEIEAVMVMLFYQTGEYLQERAVNFSRKSISELLSVEVSTVKIKMNDEEVEVEIESVLPGDIIIIKNGETIPLDGEIVEGTTYLDTKALTGESLHRVVKVGDEVLSGSINMGTLVEIKVNKIYKDSTMKQILDMVENASSTKAKSENFITKFAKVYTPLVVAAALIIAVGVPFVLKLIEPASPLKELFLGSNTNKGSVYHAMIFLVISCPCALVISIPLTFFKAIGTASKNGILVKGSNYFEALNNVENVVFDKTGTLTKGEFGILKISPATNNITNEELLRLVAYSEFNSTHPIGMSIVEEYGRSNIFPEIIEEFTDITGRGVKAVINGAMITVANGKYMRENKISIPDIVENGLILYVIKEKVYQGYVVVGDKIREDAFETIVNLRKQGVKKVTILTGDAKGAAESVANSLNVNEVYYELLPIQKVEKLGEIKNEVLSKNGKTIYVGDGINDAPVISNADVGIAMGISGSKGAIAIADVVIMSDNLEKVNDVIEISKRTRKIVIQNIVLALTVKITVMILSLLNVPVTIWLAIFSDVGVSLLAIFNAMRLNLKKKSKVKDDEK